MIISRQFAQILIDLLENNSNYDKKTAIKQIKSAIRDEIWYAHSKPESRRITPFFGHYDDGDDDDVRNVRRRIESVIDAYDQGREYDENGGHVIEKRTIRIGQKKRHVI